MAERRAHLFDEVSDELFSWLSEEPAYYAEALKSGQRAPFSASITEKQKRDYYLRQVFAQRPDGTIDAEKPNEKGREALIQQVGLRQYTEIMGALMPRPGTPANQDYGAALEAQEAGEEFEADGAGEEDDDG